MSDDFHRMVAEFMREDGFDALFIKQLPGIPNDDNGTFTAEVAEVPIRAIKMDAFGTMSGYRAKAQTLIQEGDQLLYVQPTEQVQKLELVDPMNPDPTSDRVSINGVLWKVVTVKETNPSASDCVLYEMYIRR